MSELTLVERMARADCEFRGWTWDALSAADKRQYVARNTAVLKAMRKPNERMVAAGGFSSGAAAFDEYEAAIDKWQAMIDAALREANE